MMRTSIIRFIILISFFHIHAYNSFEFIIEPQWQELDNNPITIKQYGGKWILAGMLKVKKRSKQTVILNRLILKWKGSFLENLTASLYKKPLDKDFLPLEEYLVCDSSWNKKTQELILTFDKNLMLESLMTLCLVLTLPIQHEHIIKSGYFQLEHCNLPEIFQRTTTKNSFMLTFDRIPSLSSSKIAS